MSASPQTDEPQTDEPQPDELQPDEPQLDELQPDELGPLAAAPRASALDPGGRFLERPLEHALAAALLAREDRRPIRVAGPAGVGKTALLARLARRLLARGVRLEQLAWAGPVGSDFDGWLTERMRRAGARAHRPLVLLIDELQRVPGAAERVARALAEGAPLRCAAGDSPTGDEAPGRSELAGWRSVHLGPRTADELVDDPGRRAPVRDRSLREVFVAATRKSRFAERRAGLRARRSLVLGGGFPEALEFATAERDDALREAGGARAGVERWMGQRVLEPGLAGLAATLELPVSRMRELCGVLALRRGRALRLRAIAAGLRMEPAQLARALATIEARGWIERSAAFGRRGAGAEFAVHWPCVALRRVALPAADRARPRLVDELDGLLAAHVVAVARARGSRLGHLGAPGALALVLDDGRRPLALLGSDDGAGRRGLLRRAIAKHPALAGGCFLVLRDSLPLTAPPGEDGIGSLSLDQALLLLGRRVRGLQLCAADPLSAGVQQLAF